MKQFKTVFKFELGGYFKSKVFVGVTLLLVAAIAAVMFFPRIKPFFKSDGNKEQLPTMLIDCRVGETETVSQLFKAAFPDYNVELTDKGTEALKELIIGGDAECAFTIASPTEYTCYVNDLSIYDMNCEAASEILKQVYLMQSLVDTGLSSEQAAEIMSVEVTGETVSLGKDQMSNFVYTYIMVFALYMVILLYGQMVATNVATEKSSRAMEVLITSAKPTSMMFGKVLASCFAGFAQLIAIFGAAIFFYNLNEKYWGGNEMIASIFNMPIKLLLFMLLFFVLGFFIYAFLYGAVGSTASKLEDINTSVMPITFTFIIAFLVVMLSMSAESIDSTVMKVCSYIPFTSPMAMFTRIAMSIVPWYEITISVGVLAASVIGVGVLAAKIYRVGVLLYGTSPKPWYIIKAVFKNR